MYQISVEASFDSAHFLAGYEGKCGNIHGHRWKVVVTAQAEELTGEGQCEGMVLDFSDIKREFKALIEEYDHCLLIEQGSLQENTMQCLEEEGFRIVPLPFRPTAEQFSKFFFRQMKEAGYPIFKVEVYETPNNRASYESVN